MIANHTESHDFVAIEPRYIKYLPRLFTPGCKRPQWVTHDSAWTPGPHNWSFTANCSGCCWHIPRAMESAECSLSPSLLPALTAARSLPQPRGDARLRRTCAPWHRAPPPSSETTACVSPRVSRTLLAVSQTWVRSSIVRGAGFAGEGSASPCRACSGCAIARRAAPATCVAAPPGRASRCVEDPLHSDSI